ncbi:MAG: 6-carboxytetrahydropterin synthase [Gammaproteobacteria bacterium]|nr:6-carboxytetrahydropterin synthase [Gammaproteobacteria bacterium]MCP5426060.1 6-carboxytetrahydropterin synthase [Gammaproteobacteria bacterium]
MYSVCVRDHFMIAHSFTGETFGPAQRLHGATYVVDAELRRAVLDADSVVVDIGRLSEVLRSVLNEMNYHNLDQMLEFGGRNTTTEFLAKVIFDRLAARIHNGALGGSAANGVSSMRITLHESHVAWAAYEAELNTAS